ncbi:hypothetical protein P3S68_028426 [Capsicum galapagoense]
MKYFIWLLYHNKLPTAYYLQKIGMNVDPKPQDEGLKLYVDGSYDATSNAGGAGGLLRNAYGDWVWGFNAKFTALSAIHAETLALYLGLKMAKKLQCDKLIVATDSTALQLALNDTLVADNNLISLCRVLLQELGIAGIHREDRRCNEAVGTLVKQGRKKEVTKFFEEWAVPLCLFVELSR